MTDPQPVDIDEPSILIRISQLWEPGMSGSELYDATRGHWTVGLRREHADLALAVANGFVREVYAIESWHQAGTTPSITSIHSGAPPGRFEFVGLPAADAIRSKYVGRSVRHYFTQGNQNPIHYVNC